MENQQKGSEKKQATILYADLTGINDLSEKIEVEELTRIMNSCFGLISSVVELYGGNVNKFMGESVVASFGIFGAIENTPVKAVSAALEIQTKISDFNHDNDLAHPIGMKIGIKTGAVLSGKIGLKDKTQHTVMGETVTLASRICDIAEIDQILAGKETYQKSKDRFSYNVLEPVPVKGLREPLPVFEVKGRNHTAMAKGMQSGRMIDSAMVGRTEELRFLEKQFMQLINGRGSVVNIVGKAGIGKSRLMAEIRQKELVKKVAFFEGRALSNGKNLSFHPIIQIIKSWAGIKEEDSLSDSVNKLQKNIRRVYALAYDEIFPFIATMMGYRLDGKEKERIIGIEGEALEKLILKNLRDLLSMAASVRPVVIVIEDAHWADISSILFLESLFKLTRKHRILFVNVFRPGHKETGERIAKFLVENQEDHFTEIKIEALNQHQSEELIHNLLHQANLPEEIHNLIIDRSLGNPFFIEEVIRSFIDEGLIETKGDDFVLTENIKYANIPESIDNVLLSRIDRLDNKTKDLLKTASVIGRNFYYKVLEQATQTIEEMDNRLEYLKDVQLLNERKHKDEVEFLFKHALAQQATYDSIVERSRKGLHLKIAKSIEKVFADRIHEFYGTLAHHYGKAEQQHKTEEYLIKAGEESMKSGASSEAVNYIKKALETHIRNTRNLPDRQKVVNLEEQLALALFASGQYTEAVEYFEKVICFYHKSFPITDIQRKLSLVYSLFVMIRIIYFTKPNRDRKGADIEKKILTIMDRKNRALASVDPKRMFFDYIYAFRFIRRHKFERYDASMVISGCSMFVFSGIKPLYKLDRKGIETCLKYIDGNYAFGLISYKSTLSVHAYYTGVVFDSKDEETIYKQGISIGKHWPLTVYYFHGGYCIIETGNRKRSQLFIQRLKGVAEVLENSYALVQSQRLNAFYNLKFRNIEDTLEITEAALSLSINTNHTLTIIGLYCFRSIAFSLIAKLEDAKTNLAETQKYLKGIKLPMFQSWYLIAKSYIEIAEYKLQKNDDGDRKTMLKTSKQLIKHANKAKKNLTEAYGLRAIALWLLNKPSGAIRNFEKSIKSGLSYDCTLELSRTYFEAGKFLRDPKNKKERINGMNGTECLMKAKSMFEEMNLQWDLMEYEKYLEG
nr:AAA family ATPase [Bacteroidota bacterium]